MPKGNVLLVDDEPDAGDSIRSELDGLGFRVRVATNFDEFRSVARGQNFDAAFIDWRLEGIDRGPDILQFLERRTPYTARAVVTKHSDVAALAAEFGADAFIEKSMPSLERRHLGLESVGLGLVLRTSTELARLDPGMAGLLPEVRRTVPLDPELVKKVRQIANQRCDAFIRDGTNVRGLLELLYRSEWRPEFPVSEFHSASWGRKLRLLTEKLALDDFQIAQMCSCDPSLVSAAMGGRVVPKADSGAIRAIDQLFSILCFVLEMADFDEAMLAATFEDPKLGQTMSVAAPWNTLGLRNYLSIRGQGGLSDCLGWIRRH
jgi:CheY-like chemotaxis protein